MYAIYMHHRVNWEFLREVLLRKGFSVMTVHRLMQLVQGGQTSINVNREIWPFFCNAWGVRQGDLLSPILFDFLVDSLAAILSKPVGWATSRGLCPTLTQGVSHLQYTDDTIILIEPSDEGITHLKLLLLCFENMSGLKINFDKSEVLLARG
jgi:hypothetical protein